MAARRRDSKERRASRAAPMAARRGSQERRAEAAAPAVAATGGSRQQQGQQQAKRSTSKKKASASAAGSKERPRSSGKQAAPKRSDTSLYNEDAEMVRWTFKPPDKFRPKYVQAVKGSLVRHVSTGRMEEFSYEIPKVEIVDSGLRGFINPSFIVSRKTLLNTTDPLLSNRWFVGNMGPIDASMLLIRTNEGPFPPAGAMIVCAPPEYERTSAWREYLVLIRMYAGSEAAATKRFTDKHALDQALKFDRFPGMRAVPSLVIYVRVRRDRYGMYYCRPGNECYPTLDDCIAELHTTTTDEPWPLCPDVDGFMPLAKCWQATKSKYVDTPPPPAIPQRFADWLEHGGDPNEPFAKTESPMLAERPKEAVLTLGKRLPDAAFGMLAGTQTHCADYGVKRHAKLVAKCIGDKQAAFAVTHSNAMETLKRVGRDRPMRGAYYLAKYYEVATLKDSVAIVREYFEHGSVEEVLQKHYDKKCLPSRGLIEIGYQVCSALDYLHDNELMHGRVTASNVMVHAMAPNSISVRLADYYVLTPALKDADLPPETDSAHWGKARLEHNAPEVLAAAQYTKHSDMWSFAVLLCELYNGCRPADRAYGALLPSKHYEHWTPDRLRRALLEGDRPTQPADMPPDPYMLCHWCWQLQPKRRPKAHIMYGHLNDLLFNMLHGAATAILQIHIPDDVIIPKTTTTKKHGRKHTAK